jgi:hypothetical protein
MSEIFTRFRYPPVVTSQLLKRKIILPTLCPRHAATIINTSSGMLGECCESYLLRSSRAQRVERQSDLKLKRH